MNGIWLRRLGGQSRQHKRLFRCYPKGARRLQRAPDVRVFRAAIEGDQPDAVEALDLVNPVPVAVPAR